MKLTDPVDFARDFAAALHLDQRQYYGDKPYLTHLQSVVRTLIHFNFTDRDILAAGYLHDLVEDTGVSPVVIRELFGDAITDLVMAVTDEPGANRKERKAKTYPKIKAGGEKAVALKLADRIANVEHGLLAGDLRMQKMYKKEFEDFNLQLRTVGQLEPMWAYLQSLHHKTP
jgi:(p)ppGpp synthase/HD superfamily hydrolase